MRYIELENQLNARLKLSRVKKLIGQDKTAQFLKTTVLSVRNWEQGRFTIRKEIYDAICQMPEPVALFDSAGRIYFDIHYE